MADMKEQSAADVARDQASTVGEEIRQKGAEAAEAAKSTAREYAERARDEAYSRGEQYRDYAADETSKVASALRKASEDLSSGSPQERLLAQVADTVADTADRMRGMTLTEAFHDSTEFARRHPAAFLSGAALVGFAAARFMKASAAEEDTLYLPAERSAGTSPAPSQEPIPSPATTSPYQSNPSPSGPATGPQTSKST